MEKCNEDLYSVQFIVIILRMGACVQMLKHTYVLKKYEWVVNYSGMFRKIYTIFI